MTWQGQDTDATLGGKPLFCQLWNAEFCPEGQLPALHSSFSRGHRGLGFCHFLPSWLTSFLSVG